LSKREDGDEIELYADAIPAATVIPSGR